MKLEKAAFPEQPCTRESARRWLKSEYGASAMVVPEAQGHHYPPHHHDCHEIIVGIESRTVFPTEGRELAIEAGEVLCLLEGTVHEARRKSST